MTKKNKKNQNKQVAAFVTLCTIRYAQGLTQKVGGGGGLLRLTWKDNYITNHILFMRFSDKSIQFSMILFFRRDSIGYGLEVSPNLITEWYHVVFSEQWSPNSKFEIRVSRIPRKSLFIVFPILRRCFQKKNRTRNVCKAPRKEEVCKFLWDSINSIELFNSLEEKAFRKMNCKLWFSKHLTPSGKSCQNQTHDESKRK